MARPSNQINIRLLNKVCLLYYNLELTQQEIANRLNLSRPKVSRLLKQAREHGVVKISVEITNGNYVDQEIELEKKFGLKEVIIVESMMEYSSSSVALKLQLGKAGANYLQRTITDNTVVGVTWGTTLSAMVESMMPVPTQGVRIVQLLGGVGPPEAKEHAIDLTRRIAQLLDGRPILLQAPGIVNSPQARQVLLADRRVGEALELFPKIDIAFAGIGAISTNPVLQKDNPELFVKVKKEILESNAIGDISLNFFDSDGNPVNTVFKDLFIGISLEEMKKVKTVVGIAGGDEKFEAILGALQGKHINVLITDHKTAIKLISQ
ncbi:MAG: sugar-binding transcriptional regulator [Balneolaceae bacterium]|nr:MAG: sugar-binding transcriptional regulator [Balneolaceae bacterium]